MSKCENCRLRKESAKAFDIHWHGEADCPYAHCPVPDFPKTNADRIRSMTDEELAEFLETLCPSYNWTLTLHGMTWFGFLKQEVSANDS